MVNHFLEFYEKRCSFLQVSPDPAVVGTLKTGSTSLEVMPCEGNVAEARWLALVELLLSRHEVSDYPPHLTNFSLRARSPSVQPCGGTKEMAPIKFLDVSGYGVAGRNAASVLCTLLSVNDTLTELNLAHSLLDAKGAAALGKALQYNTTLKTLNLEGNAIGHEGATALAEGLTAARRETGLVHLDANHTSSTFHGVEDIVAAVKTVNATRVARGETGEASQLVADLERNFTTEEVANSVSHGFAVVMALVGACLLLPKAYARSENDFLACLVFVTSMLTCYVSSTLYHSLYSLKRAQVFFRILDHSAIYLLIAGTYTPMVLVNFAHVPDAQYLLILQWVTAFIGISLKGLSAKTKELQKVELLLFTVMGWSALWLAPDILASEPYFRDRVVLGGVMYTVGIFFFIRGDVWPMYHAVWHLFTMAGGMCHFLAIYHTIRTAPIVVDAVAPLIASP